MTETAGVTAYWEAANHRDWAALAALLTDDVVYRIPQSGEQITGRERYIRFNDRYPGDWSIQVERVVASAGQAVSWISFDVDGRRLTAVTFFRFTPDGLIAQIDDFWPEPYAAPPRPSA